MPEVVIVGGGVAGISASYYLAKAGAKPVVIEKDAIAAHASGFAYGGLGPLSGAGIPGPMAEMARESFQLHKDLAESLPEESGIDYEYKSRPSVSLAFDDEEGSRIRMGMEWQNRHDGFSAEWLDPKGLREVDIRISPDAVGGCLLHGLAEVEPYKFVLALAQAAERMGADVRHGVVTGLERSGSRVTGVVTGSGRIPCDVVVLALGPWSGSASEWTGVPMPVEPLKGQILRLNAPPPVVECSIGWSHNYATTKGDGLLWVGTTEERAGFDDAPTAQARDEIMSALLRMMPAMEDAELVRQTACLRPVTPDGLLVLGEIPGWDGLFIATGAGRKGILYGPGIGLATADLVLSRRTSVGLASFDPGRFAS